MGISRQFIGWDRPVLERVTDFILPQAHLESGVVDLGGLLVVAPTQQAGRRIRRELAARCAAAGKACLAPRVCTPNHILEAPPATAAPALVAAAWAMVLADVETANYPHLFPTRPANHNFAWALQLGRLLQDTRDQLLDGLLRPAEVAARNLAEPERWAELASLEEKFVEVLRRKGLQDPVLACLTTAKTAQPPEGVGRVMVAAVPDAPLLLFKVLERWAAEIEVTVLVHADPCRAAAFDAWGLPLPEAWMDEPIDIADTAIWLEAGPAAQARRVLDRIARSGADAGRIAIGAPDPEVAAALAAELEACGLPVFDPAPRPLASHPLARLLAAIEALADDQHIENVAGLLRQPDLLACLEARKTPAAKLLAELDRMRDDHLPETLDAMRHFAAAGFAQNANSRHPGFEHLPAGIEMAERLLAEVRSSQTTLGAALRRVLAEIFAERQLAPENAGDRLWQTAALEVNAALEELEVAERSLGLQRPEAWALLHSLLARAAVSLPREDALVELDGWLELAWNPAPVVIATGCNEGTVPDGRLDDAFLPDSLRQKLGLRRDATRLARDAFLLKSLLQSRAAGTSLILGKHSLAGDPLKPSRLLFRCADHELPARVLKLGAAPASGGAAAPPAPGFPPSTKPKGTLPPGALNLEKISPSRLRDYLDCPFRYYLKHLLNMERRGQEADELDALHYGNLIHAALESLKTIPDCQDQAEIHRHLLAALHDYADRQYGPRRSFLVDLQLDTARERLDFAAAVQAREVRDGWRIFSTEINIADLGNSAAILPGVILSGRLDRIERREVGGRYEYRILDYKTSEANKMPAATHFSRWRQEPWLPAYRRAEFVSRSGRSPGRGVEKAWTDLQLPLYALAWRQAHPEAAALVCGYFNLSAGEAAISPFPELADPALLEQARACAAAAVADIRRGRFWPPAPKPKFDDFAGLFPFPEADCVAWQEYFDGDGLLK